MHQLLVVDLPHRPHYVAAVGLDLPGFGSSGTIPAKAWARSNAAAAASSAPSQPRRPTSCMPIGRPLQSRPTGKLMAGTSTRLMA